MHPVPDTSSSPRIESPDVGATPTSPQPAQAAPSVSQPPAASDEQRLFDFFHALQPKAGTTPPVLSAHWATLPPRHD